jgi:putative holliday junction resolvase
MIKTPARGRGILADTVTEGRVLGLDVGDRWIGVAMSDPRGILASPLTRIDRAGAEVPVEAIRRLVSQHGVKRVVAGLPYSMDGSLGKQAELVLGFLRKLSESLEVPIETRDERLSTVTASRRLIEGGGKRGSRKERIDAAAAALVLQAYLDEIRVEQGQS